MRISDWSSDVCSSDLIAHDPTQRNRQGPDVGTQYRSAIFPATEAQRRIAEAYIAQLDRSGDYSRPLATTVEKLQGFYPAEAYHQDYLVRHPDSMYIVINDQPKVENLARMYDSRYRHTQENGRASCRERGGKAV